MSITLLDIYIRCRLGELRGRGRSSALFGYSTVITFGECGGGRGEYGGSLSKREREREHQNKLENSEFEIRAF